MPADCDPLCIDAGRYRVTEEVVDDTAGEHRLWQRRVSERLPWEDAARYCAGLVLDGMGDWRLPSPGRAQWHPLQAGRPLRGRGSPSLLHPVDRSGRLPRRPPADLFWTSRRMPDDTAWYVGFDDGRSHRTVRTDELWVRCTRGPLP